MPILEPDDRLILPHRLPPRKPAGAAASSGAIAFDAAARTTASDEAGAAPAQDAGEAEASAQLALDYFYRGSQVGDAATPTADVSDLPADVPLEPLNPAGQDRGIAEHRPGAR